jgi:hypothetical protein
MAIFQNLPTRSCFALKQCYQEVLPNSARKQRYQAVVLHPKPALFTIGYDFVP